MTRLILIRHGETDYHLENKYCGFSNPALNKNGIWQSEKLAAELKGAKVDKIYSSDLKRAYETATIIFEDNPIEKTPEFREMNFGIFEGLRYEEIIQKYAQAYRNWIDNPMKVKILQGESIIELSSRVKEGLSLILSGNKGKTVALVAHAGPIRVTLCDALKFSLDAFWEIEQDIGALNIVDYPENSSPTVVKMNDTSHLTVPEEIAL